MKKGEGTVRKREVKAVLFDLDGVLVDSINAWFHVFNDTLRHFCKKTLTRSQFARIFGMSIDRASDIYFNRSPVKKIEKVYLIFFKKRIKYVKLYPQSIPVLQEIKKRKIRTALITNSPKSLVLKILRHHGLKKYFNATITIDDVKKGKPEPDIVLKAIKILNVSPRNTILIGDTRNDMIAGKKAGCITIGYKVKGDHIINNLVEIERFLKN